MKKKNGKKSGSESPAAKAEMKEEPPRYGAVPDGGRTAGTAAAAVALFQQGFNCCQAVLAVYAERQGLDRRTALKLGTGFGGGVSHQGELCGAVTGAVLALGLKHGRCDAEDEAAKQRTMELVRQFVSRFKQRHGALVCRQLLGCDLSKPAEFEWAGSRAYSSTRCPKLVQDAVEILEEME